MEIKYVVDPIGSHILSIGDHAVLAISRLGTIEDVWVDKDYRRKGLATTLFRVATRHPDIPGPFHSDCRSTAGDAWARSVGGDLPECVPFDHECSEEALKKTINGFWLDIGV